MIADLKDRLKRSRELPAPLEDVGWTYGVNGRYMKTVRDYWLNKYDFKARERILNKYPQFVTNIQGTAAASFFGLERSNVLFSERCQQVKGDFRGISKHCACAIDFDAQVIDAQSSCC